MMLICATLYIIANLICLILLRLPLPAKIFNFINKMESELKSYTHFSELG